MNKPLDPERIENENAAEEMKENITPQEENVNLIEDKQEELVTSKETTEEAIAAESMPVCEIPVKENDPAVEESTENEEALAEVSVITDNLSKEEIVEKLAASVEEPLSGSVRNLVEALKQAFYRLKRLETEEAKKAFVEAGGIEEEFESPKDELEETLKNLLTVYREKKAALNAEEERVKEENLNAKKKIIEQIRELSESKDDFYKVYNEFRKLQQDWKEIKHVPQAAVNDLWKEYQHYTEKFYDLVKINNEMRDYDFKKNLELKQALCEAVERLDSEQDVISAFYQLQKLHQEWREIGPVSRELREEVWERFKQASSIINKKHQQHFDSLRELEQRNLEEKITLCEEIETIEYDKLVSIKDWNDKSKRVLELQEKWKTIGFVPKKHNNSIFERFRAACDSFFAQKSEFYQNLKDNRSENLAKKLELCEKAEALKESQEWKETSDKLIALQKEWKKIGPIPYKQAEAVWKRFISACDYFFEQRNQQQSSQKNEEQENLRLKKEIIEKIEAIDSTLPAKEAIAEIHELMAQFRQIGFVPYREKDKIYKEYRAAVDKHFDRLKVDGSQRRLESFKNNLTEMASSGKSKNKVLSERDKLMRTHERLRNDIQTYENNIGFLSISSKGGGSLVKEMQRKIESLKEELVLIEKKIEVIDENLGFEQ